jgi:hypothetical protein
VLLTIPPRVRFPLPVLSGVTEEQTEADRRVRVKAMQHLLTIWARRRKIFPRSTPPSTLEMRVIAEIDGHAVELWIGRSALPFAVSAFCEHYEEIRKHSEQAAFSICGWTTGYWQSK